jgi:hypothetical protein
MKYGLYSLVTKKKIIVKTKFWRPCGVILNNKNYEIGGSKILTVKDLSD